MIKRMTTNHKDLRVVTIADLYPELPDDKQEEAAYNLERYLDVICRIYERHHPERSPSGAKPQI
jgi:hypothetical protein